MLFRSCLFVEPTVLPGLFVQLDPCSQYNRKYTCLFQTTDGEGECECGEVINQWRVHCAVEENIMHNVFCAYVGKNLKMVNVRVKNAELTFSGYSLMCERLVSGEPVTRSGVITERFEQRMEPLQSTPLKGSDHNKLLVFFRLLNTFQN